MLACLVCGSAVAVPWSASVGENGLPIVARGGVAAVTSRFAFWGANWTWADPQAKVQVTGPFEYILIGRAEPLELEFQGRITKVAAGMLQWRLEVVPLRDIPYAVGGVSFHFDLTAFAPQLGEPRLLAHRRGWVWGRDGGTRMEMRFDPPLAALHFERGRKAEIRAYFHAGPISSGRRRHVITLSVSPDMRIGPSLEERLGTGTPGTWPVVFPDAAELPVDVSFLSAGEKPAGKHGFSKAVGDRLVFEDGTAARFWGTNLTAQALFQTSPEEVRRQARRLSMLGFNLVRIHHHDSEWVDPNVFGEGSERDAGTLSDKMLRRLDWWIKCLREEGIYVWLDLHVGRHLRPGDGVEHFDEISKGGRTAPLRGYNYVNDSIRAAMMRFNESYLNRRNAFTGLRYREDPAIVGVLVTNENDVTHHFANVLLPDKGVPRHGAAYLARANQFAEAHGLPKDAVWRSWIPGPSKRFLNDLEWRFHSAMLMHLRALGVRMPIVPTSTWGFSPLYSLPALTAGDVIDVHAYGGADEVERSPHIAPNLLHWIATARVSGKPLTVSEWNVSPFPAFDRHLMPVYVAAQAALQGWSAVMQYAFSQVSLDTPGKPSNWHAFNDPALLATLPAAAVLFRRGDVRESPTVYAFAPSPEQLFDQAVSARTSAALRTAVERGKTVVVLPYVAELPWLRGGEIPAGAKVITDPAKPLVAMEATAAVSDSGELRRDWEKGVFTVETARTQLAGGWIGGRSIELRDVRFDVTTPSATVVVQSLDGAPIGQSRRLMVALAARSLPSEGNRLPFRSEPVLGRLTIRAVPGLVLRSDPRVGGSTIALPYVNGRYELELGRAAGAHWLLLSR